MPNPRLLIAVAAIYGLPAFAQSAESSRVDQTRARLGVGYWGGYSNISGNPAIGFLGLAADGGIQLNDRVAFFLRGQFSTMFLAQMFGAQAIAELTLGHLFSIGTGFGMIGHYDGPGCFLGCSSEPLGIAVGVPVRVALNLGSAPTETRRNRFTISVDSWFGRTLVPAQSSFPFAWSVGATLGYQMM